MHNLLPPMTNLSEMNTSNTHSCFPHVINDRNKLDPNIRSSSNCNLCRNTFLNLYDLLKKNLQYNDPFGITMLIRLTLGFRHFREHQFRHGFKDTLNPFCSCSIEDKTTMHYFVRFHFYNSNRGTKTNDLVNG